jgi:hypothetical protein
MYDDAGKRGGDSKISCGKGEGKGESIVEGKGEGKKFGCGERTGKRFPFPCRL